MSHSEGPWHVEETPEGFVYVWLGTKDMATRRVIVAWSATEGRKGVAPDGTDRANARLIEQAPTMFDAVKLYAVLLTPHLLEEVSRKLGGEYYRAFLEAGASGVRRVLDRSAWDVIGRVTGGEKRA